MAQDGSQDINGSAPRLAASLLQRLGPTYTKLGQLLAATDALPREYAEAFEACLDASPPVPWSEVERCLKEELGDLALFESIDKSPLATGSVAQVHRAVLKGSLRDVCVKVLKPGVESSVGIDTDVLSLAATALETLNPRLQRLDLARLVGEVRETLVDELDLSKEASNIQAFSRFVDAGGYNDLVVVPAVFTNASTKRILTTEFIDGTPLSDSGSEAALRNALRVWTASLAPGGGVFHADVHSGNVLALNDGTDRVAFVDWGIVGSVDPNLWQSIEVLMRALASAVPDYATAARALAAMGDSDTTADAASIDALAVDLERILTNAERISRDATVSVVVDDAGQPAALGVDVSTIDSAEVASLLLDVVDVVDKSGLRIPREGWLLLKSLSYWDRHASAVAGTTAMALLAESTDRGADGGDDSMDDAIDTIFSTD